MCKKLTYEYVKNFINSTGYTLLSDTYSNNSTKLLVKCDKGHEYNVKFNVFEQGSRCPVCSNRVKYTYEYVKNYIENEGYTLLSDSYINNKTKLSVRCDKGHEYNVTFHTLLAGQRCAYCYGNNKKTIDEVKSYIEKEGYTLLSDSYKNSSSKLSVRCDKGHEYSVTFHSFHSGSRCVICSGNKKHTYEHVKSYIEKEGYTLLSDSYKSNRDRLLIRCNEGHEYVTKFNTFKSGGRCLICSGKMKHTYEYVKNYIEKEGYTLLSDSYKNAGSKLSVKCDKGHEYSVTFGNFRGGCRCPVCNYYSKSSKGEQSLQLYIESFGIPMIRNDRTQIINPLTGYNLELDIWIPSMNKAIEYNGLYWHSHPNKKYYDKIKHEQCKQLGIDLLVVGDEQWNNYKEVEMKRIEQWLLK